MAEAEKRFYSEIWPHAATVLRLAKFLCRDEAEAEDLAQEVLLKAFRHLDQLRAGTDAAAWLTKILRNTRIDRLRAQAGRERDVSLDQIEHDPPAAEEPVIQESEGPDAALQQFSDRQVIEALLRLPEEIRWTLLLVDVQGMDQADAAAILDVPVGTVKSRMHRGRGMLRTDLSRLARDLRLIR